MTTLYEISYYGIEQHITLTLPAWLCLFTASNYMTLFNTLALHAIRWCNGMSLASHGEGRWFETHTILCSINYFYLLSLFCTFCSLFHAMANISIFLSHWYSHINFYFPFSQLMCRCLDWNACKNWWYFCTVLLREITQNKTDRNIANFRYFWKKYQRKVPFSFLPFDNCISGILYLKFEEKIYLSKNIIAKKVFLPIWHYGKNSLFCHFRKLENFKIFIGYNIKSHNETS